MLASSISTLEHGGCSFKNSRTTWKQILPESRASTVPLDVIPSGDNVDIIKSDCREKGQRARASSRSLRDVSKRDYAYHAYKEVMDAATATANPCKSRRKTAIGKRTRDPTDFGSIIVRNRMSSTDIRH